MPTGRMLCHAGFTALKVQDITAQGTALGTQSKRAYALKGQNSELLVAGINQFQCLFILARQLLLTKDKHSTTDAWHVPPDA